MSKVVFTEEETARINKHFAEVNEALAKADEALAEWRKRNSERDGERKVTVSAAVPSDSPSGWALGQLQATKAYGAVSEFKGHCDAWRAVMDKHWTKMLLKLYWLELACIFTAGGIVGYLVKLAGF